VMAGQTFVDTCPGGEIELTIVEHVEQATFQNGEFSIDFPATEASGNGKSFSIVTDSTQSTADSKPMIEAMCKGDATPVAEYWFSVCAHLTGFRVNQYSSTPVMDCEYLLPADGQRPVIGNGVQTVAFNWDSDSGDIEDLHFLTIYEECVSVVNILDNGNVSVQPRACDWHDFGGNGHKEENTDQRRIAGRRDGFLPGSLSHGKGIIQHFMKCKRCGKTHQVDDDFWDVQSEMNVIEPLRLESRLSEESRQTYPPGVSNSSDLQTSHFCEECDPSLPEFCNN